MSKRTSHCSSPINPTVHLACKGAAAILIYRGRKAHITPEEFTNIGNLLSIQCLHSSLGMTEPGWWLVRMAILPFAQPPTFETLINRGSRDMISFYEKARSLAENLGFICGKDYHQKLIQAL